jgi:hypothetical protein
MADTRRRSECHPGCRFRQRQAPEAAAGHEAECRFISLLDLEQDRLANPR